MKTMTISLNSIHFFIFHGIIQNYNFIDPLSNNDLNRQHELVQFIILNCQINDVFGIYARYKHFTAFLFFAMVNFIKFVGKLASKSRS